jgi:hypothetical protein
LQSPEHVANRGDESYGSEDEHQKRFGVKPAIEEETEETADKRASDEEKWEFHRKGELARKST